MMLLVLCLLARLLFHICPRSNCGWKAVGGALESCGCFLLLFFLKDFFKKKFFLGEEKNW